MRISIFHKWRLFNARIFYAIRYGSTIIMKKDRNFIGLIIVFLFLAAPVFAVEIGHWDSRNAPLLKQDINTASKVGQWTETFAGKNWGIGSWVDGNATDASGKLIWKLEGPTIVASHPSVLSDTDGDGLPDMILTHYQGGSFTLYDAHGLWGAGAVFICVDTVIEDHFNPVKKTYEYGFVNGLAENKDLGLAVYLDARVIETSTAGNSHSGELTGLNLTIVSQPIRRAIEKRFPDAHIRGIQKEKRLGLLYYKVSFVSRGKKMVAEVYPEGVLGEVESIVTIQEVPESVARTINEKLQGQKICKIKRLYCFGSVKSEKWVNLDKPTLFFEVQYLLDGKKKNLLIEHDFVMSQFSRKQKQQWAHDGNPVQVFSLPKKVKSFLDKQLSKNKKD